MKNVGTHEDTGTQPLTDPDETEDENVFGDDPIKIDDTIYPIGSYVNVRSSANVNNGYINNIITTIDNPNPIGVVTQITISEGHTWYGVSLNDFPLYDVGYVRADVVTKNI